MPTPSQEELLKANEELFCHTSAIPVQNRLRYLVENDPDPKKYHQIDYTDADELAFLLGKTEEEIFKLIDDLNVPEGILQKDKFNCSVLMPGMREVIEEEVTWRESYSLLEDEVSSYEIARAVGASEHFTRQVIQRTGILPQPKPGRENRGRYYPKQLAYRVRAELMTFPPARDNKNLDDLKEISRRSVPWLTPRLDPEFYGVTPGLSDKDAADFAADFMRNKNNKVLIHFGKGIVELIRKDAERQREIESTSTSVKQAAKKLDRDSAWVRARTRKPDWDQNHGRVRPDEEKRLHAESEWQRNLPPFAEGEMTTRQIAKLFGVGGSMVETAAGVMRVEPKQRKTKNNRVAGVYDADDRLLIAQGICDWHKSQVKKLESSLTDLRLTNEGKRLKRINLARQQKLYHAAVELYEKLAEERRQVA